MIVDLYAGPGGWSEALRILNVAGEVGIEWDAAACATRAAAGHLTVRADIGTYPTAPFRGRVRGLIGSPPCPAFSGAGLKHGTRLLPELVDAVHARDWTRRPDPDPEVWLVVDLGRWLVDLDPEWITLEQVPAVLPVWRAYAHVLADLGYSTWTGVLSAADYGVPQTRERAILIASRTRRVVCPPATHAELPAPTLFGADVAPWVTMADALGWNDRVGFPRRDDIGTSADGYRERDWRTTDRPAPTLTQRVRDWRYEVDRRQNGAPIIDPHTSPSPTLTGAAIGRTVWTVHRTDGDDVERVRLTIGDALTLQSFRPDYPVQGSRTKQFEQVGNAIPPGLAAAVLAVVT